MKQEARGVRDQVIEVQIIQDLNENKWYQKWMIQTQIWFKTWLMRVALKAQGISILESSKQK
jgi:hypothetical protein